MKESEAKKRWNRAQANLSRAIGRNISDSARLNLKAPGEDGDRYLQELSQSKAKVTIKDQVFEFEILKMSEEQKLQHQLEYSGDSLKLNRRPADTTGKQSKTEDDSQAFVMSKDGKIYIGNHGENYNGKILFHGSFLDDTPVEMAGTIGLKNGKIIKLSNHIGHYKPTELDIYRGIIAIEKEMPGVLDKECVITIFDPKDSYQLPIYAFKKLMETENSKGIPLHEQLRNQRKEAQKLYNQDLYNAILFKTVKEATSFTPEIEGSIRKQLVNGARINRIDVAGKTALHYACQNGNIVLAEFLITRQAGVNIEDRSNKTVLHYACQSGHTALAESLIDHKANLFIEDKRANIPAAYANSREIAEILTKDDFIDTPNTNGKTLLMLFCQKGNKDIVDLLMRKETKELWPEYIDYQNNDGKTALMHSANIEVALKLMELGAKLDVKDNHDKSALDYLVDFSLKTAKENPELFYELIGTIANTQTPETIEATKKSFSKKGIDITLTIAQHQAKKAVERIDFSFLRGPSPVDIPPYQKKQRAL